MIQKASSAFRPRVVLDTNVCLDLFMFRDPRWQTLMDALTGGEIAALTREDCRRELALVLAYERLKLSATAQAAILAEFDQLISLHTGVPDAGADMPLTALPVCKDSDDQKFLELALACEADVLITKDKALLKLAKRLSKAGLFRVIQPEAWQNISQDATPN